MSRSIRIIKDNSQLTEHYSSLSADDIICCRLRIRPGEEHLLLDLAERGIRAIPSFRSQLCSRSKAFQTRIFSWAMVPETTAIYTVHDLLQALCRFGRAGSGQVVVKQEGKNSGLGVFLFQSIEDVYTQASLGLLPFPFVLQPYVSGYADVRVLVLGDYVESYRRSNAATFRQNLHCGGTSDLWQLSDGQLSFCRTVMRQADFPYAHLDLLIQSDGTTYLSEINLSGGLRGATIGAAAYRDRISSIHTRLLEKLTGHSGGCAAAGSPVS